MPWRRTSLLIQLYLSPKRTSALFLVYFQKFSYLSDIASSLIPSVVRTNLTETIGGRNLERNQTKREPVLFWVTLGGQCDYYYYSFSAIKVNSIRCVEKDMLRISILWYIWLLWYTCMMCTDELWEAFLLYNVLIHHLNCIVWWSDSDIDGGIIWQTKYFAES